MYFIPLRQLLRLLAIVGLLVSAHSMAYAHALPERVTMAPQLVISVADPARGTILVTGHDFTPGGQVFIDIYDGAGLDLIDSRRVRASEETFGPNGSRDPALGYVPGGTVFEEFATAAAVYGPNGSRDPALGYRDGLDGLESATVASGPNGSRDPAMAGVPASGGAAQRASSCSSGLMIQALDEQREIWSNMLDVDGACRVANAAS